MKIIAHEALKRAQNRDVIKQIREWRDEQIKMVKRITSIEKELAG